MIRPAQDADFAQIYRIINDAATAYKGVIPADRWQEPYMPEEELRAQIADGVEFLCYEEDGEVIGVMGVQDRQEVELIRHAYVLTTRRKGGIGSQLIRTILERRKKPILIGTWQAATWAIDFYRKHGFRLVDEQEKNLLLRRYWSIPDRQVETSVVLAEDSYRPEHTLPA